LLIAMRMMRTLGRMIPYVFVGGFVVVGFLIILPMMIWASLVGWLVDAIWRKASRKGQPPSLNHHTITTEKGWGMD
jgi:hypothetical protein